MRRFGTCPIGRPVASTAETSSGCSPALSDATLATTLYVFRESIR
jgi:hypothetical protein